MHLYTTGQWVLLFFFYCFCGWVWESCYVSARQHRWVNRGFLQGPLLPIYGSGAILILFVTLPAAGNLYLVFLLGMGAATALEYLTGAVMERLFQVRYWDYSKQKCNLNGYICLTSSIAWGCFSILLVRFLHPPVARLLADVPAFLVDPAAFALTAAFTVDTVRSVQAALDLKEVLSKLTEENEDLRRLAKRAEVAAAFAEEDLRKFRERTEVEKLLLQNRIEAELQEQRQARQARRLRRRERAEEGLRRRTAAKLEALGNISETLEAARSSLGAAADLTEAALSERRAELDEAIERLHRWESAIRSRSARVYARSLRILDGNPTAKARKGWGEALETLRRLGER
ncbi:putative ABC transporter permease [Dysosmobacter sp.]